MNEALRRQAVRDYVEARARWLAEEAPDAKFRSDYVVLAKELHALGFEVPEEPVPCLWSTPGFSVGAAFRVALGERNQSPSRIQDHVHVQGRDG